MEVGGVRGFLRTSPSLEASLAGIERAAEVATPVLIVGESGVGRSSLARAVHEAGPRRDQPLVVVDPAALPASLFESELFGYEKGAFTGAEERRVGRLTRAEKGTLVLDQVEAIPRAVQPKLLRLLAEQRFEPLGGKERRADIRFIALGSEDLPERVESGAFRRDLFYRLEVLAFRLPPLRERMGDLAALTSALLEDLAGRLGRSTPDLAPAALAWMEDYSWPGNLRELRNVLERALVLSPPTSSELEPKPPASADHGVPPSLEEIEIEHIRRVLAYTRGHQGRAASILGISRKNLWERRRRHGIP